MFRICIGSSKVQDPDPAFTSTRIQIQGAKIMRNVRIYANADQKLQSHSNILNIKMPVFSFFRTSTVFGTWKKKATYLNCYFCFKKGGKFFLQFLDIKTLDREWIRTRIQRKCWIRIRESGSKALEKSRMCVVCTGNKSINYTFQF